MTSRGPGGGFPGGRDPLSELRTYVQQAHAEIQQKLNAQSAWVRGQSESHTQKVLDSLGHLAQIAQGLGGSRSGGSGGLDRNIRIEDLPGRRVPYVLLVDIPIQNNTTARQEASVTISQEGPFVAVRRMATFQSALQFQVTYGDSTVGRFAGRSFGRYRPIHSAWDIGEAGSSLGATSTVLTGLPAAELNWTTSPTNIMSGFLTMEFDGRIAVINAGSSYPRQNLQDGVPSSMWTSQINSSQDLGALDFFERGEVITVMANPNHVNNPPAGNAQGFDIFGSAGWPFLDGQYDPQEGILTPNPIDPNNPNTRITTDTVVRLPDGILTVAWEGYRIIQPVGPGL